jgi:hypothetical protein
LRSPVSTKAGREPVEPGLGRKENVVRRELLVRCLALGTLRTEAPDGTWCEVRHVWLQVADSAVCVRTMQSGERRQHRVERAIELDEVSVRHRPGERALLDWIVSLAESIVEGEYSVVSVWVSSARPLALLHAIPADSCGSAATPRGTDIAAARRARLAGPGRVKTQATPAALPARVLPEA